ncbi:hypothetical protein QBC47DRAFT_360899 [Echria macrotheca]|uniref:Uncharacterized protein n=1 Tax=Echria macrotheca TaxID=438768 RepID=A0AAJ0BBN3_9PEZI|nr:hypothetical protein QBC47DRAFT_360899 [Echria macrotheca]
MCFQEFIIYQCGHESVPVVRPCPTTTAGITFQCCAMRPLKQWNALTMCCSCERILHYRWTLVREWEHRWMHERGVCGCPVRFPGLAFQPRMAGGGGGDPGPSTYTEEQQQPAGEAADIPPTYTYTENHAHGQRRVSVRIPGLYAAEWRADHARRHEAGLCKCDVSFDNFQPEVEEYELNYGERAFIAQYRELEANPAGLSEDEINARVAEVIRLFGPFVTRPAPPVTIGPSVQTYSRGGGGQQRGRGGNRGGFRRGRGGGGGRGGRGGSGNTSRGGGAHNNQQTATTKNTQPSQGQGQGRMVSHLQQQQRISDQQAAAASSSSTSPPSAPVDPVDSEQTQTQTQTQPQSRSIPPSIPIPPPPEQILFPNPYAYTHHTGPGNPTFYPPTATEIHGAYPRTLFGPGPYTTTGLLDHARNGMLINPYTFPSTFTPYTPYTPYPYSTTAEPLRKEGKGKGKEKETCPPPIADGSISRQTAGVTEKEEGENGEEGEKGKETKPLCGLPIGAGPEGMLHVPAWGECELARGARYTFSPPPPSPASSAGGDGGDRS